MYEATLSNKSIGVAYPLRTYQYWDCISILGVEPVAATINTAVSAGIDGTRFNSARLNERNIVITLVLKGDIPAGRQLLETQFSPKSLVTMRYTTDNRDVAIDGYVETFECDLHSVPETAQLSIICPDPYFHKATASEITLGRDSPGNSLGFTSTIETGLEIEATFNGAASSITITNYYPNQKIKVTHAFQSGDKLYINTTRGKKCVLLTQNNVTTNIFPSVDPDSVFITAYSGATTYYYTDTGVLTNSNHPTVKLRAYELFTGV